MAEFPDLGKHCSVESCNRLDFVPFRCNTCLKHFCGDHRLSHPCASGMTCVSGESTANKTPLRPFLCAMEGCHVSEMIRIDCPHCSNNFCLKHRHADKHNCAYLSEKKNKRREQVWHETKKLIEAESNQSAESSVPVIGSTKVARVLTEAEQKRADRIAVMKLKANAKQIEIPASEQMFLFVGEGTAREAVMISKRWTIGRCVDHIAKQLKMPNENLKFESKMLRLYAKENEEVPLPMGDLVNKHLEDMANVTVKRDS